MSKTLFDITADLRALDDLLEETGGDVSDPEVEKAIDAWFAELGADLETKVDNYAALIRELEYREKIRKDESKRLTMRARIDANAAAGLKERLKMAFEFRGIKKIETPRFKVSVAGNGGKQPLLVDHLPDEIPEPFRKVIPEQVELDKDRLREALEAGQVVDFAHLGERGTRLSIR